MSRRGFLGRASLAALAIAGSSCAPPAAAGPKTPARARPGDCVPVPGQSPKRQFRGAWIATVTNIDWPSKSGLGADEQKAELIHLLDSCVQMRLNAVVIQVRPTADAFYPSRYVPWSQYLTGVQGRDPGYDPLAFMVAEAHRRNLELHAWFNPYRVSMQADPGRLAADNPARLHPEWTVAYGGKLYFDPGIPAVRQFLEQSILEPVANYDLDAVHFDDYFYPYPVPDQTFPDAATYQQHGASQFAARDDWRRENVNLLVQELAQKIKAVKPWVKFGISPFGVWRNWATDPTGSETTAGAQNYDDLYADTRTWIRKGWLDYIAPQIYWNIGLVAADYATLVSWWAAEVQGHPVGLYIGQAAYKIGHDNAVWNDPEQMPAHYEFNRRYPRVGGDILFSMRSLQANPLGFADRLVRDIYRYPALVPEMDWLSGSAPRPPQLAEATPTPAGVALSWRAAAAGSGPAYHAVYRFEAGREPDPCDFENSSHLLGTVRAPATGGQGSFTDTAAAAGTRYAYFVTSLDRLHRESAPSNRREAGRG